MFTLAHLSDPHLPPLPEPRVSELIGKRITGYINWRRKRRFIHDAANRTRTSPALRAAAEAMIDLAGGARRAFAGSQRGADVMVGYHFRRARRDWIHWVTSAKQAETRARRIKNACSMLAAAS